MTKKRVECCGYPTQAKVRLEWGTQPSLPMTGQAG
jgi:ribosomal protein L37E